MKTIYYLASTLGSTENIADELHQAGVQDWFIHIVSKDESGLQKKHLHSSNYLETLDLLRDGVIGAILGFIIGAFIAAVFAYLQPFGGNLPYVVYAFLIGLMTLFGLWEGGLAGIASKNRKLAEFDQDIADGKYLILIYTTRKNEPRIQYIMSHKFPGVKLAAKDSHFLNPFSTLEHN
tara:strand:+ start:1841 stop:2374 length:534 start_codon:yes stop_codon:yes gene_type:complete